MANANGTEVDLIANGTTEEDPGYYFTRVYYYIFNPSNGALIKYGNRLATDSEARAANLPINKIH